MKMVKRKSNMEFLRIISMLLIITFHCAYRSGFDFENGMSINKLIVKTFWMFGELGVNEFILISGFWGIDGSFKIKKFAKLVAQVEFYHWGSLFFILCVGGGVNVSGRKEMILYLFPIISNRYWFFTAYILIYILSPYVNKFAKEMDKKMYREFLATLLILYSVLPTIFGVLYNNTETLLYYTRFLWLMIMYLLGAYIRYDDDCQTFLKKRAVIMGSVSFMVCIVSIIIFDFFNGILAKNGVSVLEIAYFWQPNSLPMVFLSVSLFGLYLRMEILNNKFINRIASTTLGVYLLHEGVLQTWIWESVFHLTSYQNSPFLIFYIMKAVMLLFVIGVLVDLVRQWVERTILNKFLNKC